MTKMLDIPRIRLYWVLEVILILPTCFFRADGGLAFRVSIGLALGLFPAFMA